MSQQGEPSHSIQEINSSLGEGHTEQGIMTEKRDQNKPGEIKQKANMPIVRKDVQDVERHNIKRSQHAGA